MTPALRREIPVMIIIIRILIVPEFTVRSRPTSIVNFDEVK